MRCRISLHKFLNVWGSRKKALGPSCFLHLRVLLPGAPGFQRPQNVSLIMSRQALERRVEGEGQGINSLSLAQLPALVWKVVVRSDKIAGWYTDGTQKNLLCPWRVSKKAGQPRATKHKCCWVALLYSGEMLNTILFFRDLQWTSHCQHAVCCMQQHLYATSCSLACLQNKAYLEQEFTCNMYFGFSKVRAATVHEMDLVFCLKCAW